MYRIQYITSNGVQTLCILVVLILHCSACLALSTVVAACGTNTEFFITAALFFDHTHSILLSFSLAICLLVCLSVCLFSFSLSPLSLPASPSLYLSLSCSLPPPSLPLSLSPLSLSLSCSTKTSHLTSTSCAVHTHSIEIHLPLRTEAARHTLPGASRRILIVLTRERTSCPTLSPLFSSTTHWLVCGALLHSYALALMFNSALRAETA